MELAEELGTAARCGDEAAMQRLLAAGARTDQADQFGRRPLHLAAYYGHEGTVMLLLEEDQATALAVDSRGCPPLYFAAAYLGMEVVKALLEAAPAAATMLNAIKRAPIHNAAFRGNTAAVQLLVEAALEVAFAEDFHNKTPLRLLLGNHFQRSLQRVEEAARCLVRAAPTVQPTLSSLVQYSHHSAALFADLVARLPLTQEQWQSIPAPCPDLARALPAVLERSTVEAGWLVGRLAEEQRAWLRMAVLCMARVERESNAVLPAELSRRILARCLLRP